jgi:hypothetical protein
MMPHCDFSAGCDKPGSYTIPTQDVVPCSIQVCATHRALWVEHLQRRTRWPCAIEGCRRDAVVDGLCQQCWVVVRGADDLIRGSDIEPALKRLAVRHLGKHIVADRPTVEDVVNAAKMLDTLRTLARSVAALGARAPDEIAPDLDEASKILFEVVRRASALAQVQVQVPVTAQIQGGLFDVRR